MAEWTRVAFAGPVVRRGLKYAVVVGAILVAINHGDAILAGRISRSQIAKMALTIIVPYCVSVLSSVGAIMQMRAQSTAISSKGTR